MLTFIAICLALLLDHLLGEPRTRHPLAGFGYCAFLIEKRLSPYTKGSTSFRLYQWIEYCKGCLAVCGLVLLPAWLIHFILITASSWHNLSMMILEILGLYICIGKHSLAKHGRAVSQPLLDGEYAIAREKTALIVSRDTKNMKSGDIIRATIESMLENANDACFASLFWFVVGGLPLAVLHRLSNTVDAMWGYKTERYRHFGWTAAKLDDLLNWIPARLTALSFALAGQTASALSCWRNQASYYESPNSGVVMAAGAGALNIRLGGNASYQGQLKQRAVLGMGREVSIKDIERSIELINQALGIWMSLLFLILYFK